MEKRKLQQDNKDTDHSYMYITPRTLLGIIRLSQALAKLNFREEISQTDVDEALRLMDFSFRTLRMNEGKQKEQNKQRRQEREQDQATEIMKSVREVLTANNMNPLSVNEILKRMQKQQKLLNVDKAKLKETLDYYANLHVVYINPDEEEVHFL